jgi:hypothetical protein
MPSHRLTHIALAKFAASKEETLELHGIEAIAALGISSEISAGIWRRRSDLPSALLTLGEQVGDQFDFILTPGDLPSLKSVCQALSAKVGTANDFEKAREAVAAAVHSLREGVDDATWRERADLPDAFSAIGEELGGRIHWKERRRRVAEFVQKYALELIALYEDHARTIEGIVFNVSSDLNLQLFFVTWGRAAFFNRGITRAFAKAPLDVKRRILEELIDLGEPSGERSPHWKSGRPRRTDIDEPNYSDGMTVRQKAAADKAAARRNREACVEE